MQLLTNTKKNEEIESKVLKFLASRRGQTFNSLELYNLIIGKISYTLDQEGSSWSWKTADKFFLDFVAHLNFRDILRRMVNTGKIKMKIVKHQNYYFK